MLKKLFVLMFSAVVFAAADPIAIEGRLTEIPGKMPSNDLAGYSKRFLCSIHSRNFIG